MDEEQKRARDVLDDLLEYGGSSLTPTEIGFIEDMHGKRKWNWTKPQINWLDRIYERLL